MVGVSPGMRFRALKRHVAPGSLGGLSSVRAYSSSLTSAALRPMVLPSSCIVICTCLASLALAAIGPSGLRT
jgi:hypothetical protein